MPAGKLIVEIKKKARDKFSQLTYFAYDSASRDRTMRRMAALKRAGDCVAGWQSRYAQFRDASFQVRELTADEAGNYGKRKGTVINLTKEYDKVIQADLVFKLEVQRQQREAEEKEKRRQAKARGEKPEPKAKAAKVIKPKKGRPGSVLGKISDEATVHLIAKGNPCRVGTTSHDMYACFKDGMTLAAYVKAGALHSTWNMRTTAKYFAKKGFISIKEKTNG